MQNNFFDTQLDSAVQRINSYSKECGIRAISSNREDKKLRIHVEDDTSNSFIKSLPDLQKAAAPYELLVVPEPTVRSFSTLCGPKR